MVTAKEVVDECQIPRYVLYRMVRDGRIRAIKQTRQPWHKRDHYQFCLDEVRAALRKPAP